MSALTEEDWRLLDAVARGGDVRAIVDADHGAVAGLHEKLESAAEALKEALGSYDRAHDNSVYVPVSRRTKVDVDLLAESEVLWHPGKGILVDIWSYWPTEEDEAEHPDTIYRDRFGHAYDVWLTQAPGLTGDVVIARVEDGTMLRRLDEWLGDPQGNWPDALMMRGFGEDPSRHVDLSEVFEANEVGWVGVGIRPTEPDEWEPCMLTSVRAAVAAARREEELARAEEASRCQEALRQDPALDEVARDGSQRG